FDNDAAVATLEPFGGELYRRQRVLDLVGDAARHIRPGRRPLGADQIADVVECYDAALVGPLRIAGYAHVEDPFTPVALEFRLPLMKPQPRRARLLQDRSKRRQDALD